MGVERGTLRGGIEARPLIGLDLQTIEVVCQGRARCGSNHRSVSGQKDPRAITTVDRLLGEGDDALQRLDDRARPEQLSGDPSKALLQVLEVKIRSHPTFHHVPADIDALLILSQQITGTFGSLPSTSRVLLNGRRRS